MYQILKQWHNHLSCIVCVPLDLPPTEALQWCLNLEQLDFLALNLPLSPHPPTFFLHLFLFLCKSLVKLFFPRTCLKSGAVQCMENPAFPKWLISTEKCTMRGKRGEQELWDGEIVEGWEREHWGRGKEELRVTGKEVWVWCEWRDRKPECKKGPNSRWRPSHSNHWVVSTSNRNCWIKDSARLLLVWSWGQFGMTNTHKPLPCVAYLVCFCSQTSPLHPSSTWATFL